MIIYNVTTLVPHEVDSEWFSWLKLEHIPAMLKTGCFTRTSIARLLEVDDTEGITYAVQYFAENRELYSQFIKIFSLVMQQQSFDKWGIQCPDFRSVMEVIN